MDKKVTRIISPEISEHNKLRQPLTPGEKIVFDYFDKNLTLDWDIYIQPHMNGNSPDFVLLSKEKGIAVFEVKDWDLSKLNYAYKKESKEKIRLIGDDGEKSFSLSKQDPFLKIRQYKSEIYDLYCPRLQNKTGFGIIFSGVIFPFANKEQVKKLTEPLPKNKTLVISSEDLSNNSIKEVIPFVYKIDQRMNNEIYLDFKPWLIEPVYSSEQRVPLINILDNQQKVLAETRTETGRRRINGPAGSGKSLVLCSRAARLASENKQVLIITYNITLVNYLLDLAVRFEMNGKVRNQITALHFHGYCKRLAFEGDYEEEYSASWKQKNEDKDENENVLNIILPKKALSWANALDEEDKYDAVFIDEGQDFRQEYLDVLRKSVKENGELLLCTDQTQNVYGNVPIPEKTMAVNGFGSKPVYLSNSYRLPLSVCKLATSFIENFLPNSENLKPVPKQDDLEFNKTALEWIQCDETNITNQTVEALLNIITKSKSIKAFADLTCIVDRVGKGKEIIKALRDKDIKCIDTFSDDQHTSRRKKMFFFKGSATVKVTTTLSFKGWEATALVLQCTSAQSEKDLALFYTAITRVKKSDQGCFLTVVNSASKLNNYGETWPHFKTIV
jgi:hypothetical protein